MPGETAAQRKPLDPAKFRDPALTADGRRRAVVALTRLKTLWFNTGSLCNITCRNCYMDSSPTNDALVYLSRDEVRAYLEEIEAEKLPVEEIAFTGGEPFMNPDMLDMARDALARGHGVLILTNAMQPMQRKSIKAGLKALLADYGNLLTLRVSLDHYTHALHETERGPRSWDSAIAGIDWLARHGFNLTLAGRTCWNEGEADARAGYAELIAARGWGIDAHDRSALVLFPEMDETEDVPEITDACWDIPGVSPNDVMCASSRMVVKRKGEDRPTVVPCTLLPYDRNFDMGATLAEAARADGGMFDRGAIRLCHPHCSKFCVLGGASCSG